MTLKDWVDNLDEQLKWLQEENYLEDLADCQADIDEITQQYAGGEDEWN